MYRPSNPPNDPAALPEYLRREQAQIAREMVAAVMSIRFVELHAPPAKYDDGETCFADGADWDPGSGRGVYTYYGGAWNKLG